MAKKQEHTIIKMLIFIVVLMIIIMSIMIFKNKSTFLSGVFDPEVKNKSMSEYTPKPLRWEKTFKFGINDKNDGEVEKLPSGKNQNFLQYESSKNK
ncbi:hypothetical protein [Arcobacter sp. CECT 8985]|uniref:hypothetical protein n=1 Tax=Arcobacter sp. CECT 8985 TaxID=1935424 RepID=UPI00100C0625|nr:hypothetical protein [Arcobacter sp. CECT 8985]RXJ87262.1 hypothetical protein CRU93_04965 [Arcobacter sp. CECT 8985]